ncbi:hypothetical protein HDU98_006886 [Podochytrium sp. JEL0797]|nr:hypothetical protein HDU98_006886 [Podochytrium sp. JEL0797]
MKSLLSKSLALFGVEAARVVAEALNKKNSLEIRRPLWQIAGRNAEDIKPDLNSIVDALASKPLKVFDLSKTAIGPTVRPQHFPTSQISLGQNLQKASNRIFPTQFALELKNNLAQGLRAYQSVKREIHIEFALVESGYDVKSSPTSCLPRGTLTRSTVLPSNGRYALNPKTYLTGLVLRASPQLVGGEHCVNIDTSQVFGCQLIQAIQHQINPHPISLAVSYTCHNCLLEPTSLNVAAALKIFTQVSKLTKDIFMVLIAIFAYKVNNKY